MTTTAQQIAAIATVSESLTKTGHTDSIDIDAQDGVTYVTGYKRAALDRCATVSDAGVIEWIR